MCHVLRPTNLAGVFTLVGDCFLFGHMRLRSHVPVVRYDVDDDKGELVPWKDVVIV